MLAIAVIGSKKSGKTTTIEALVRGLTNRGYRVATAKHVSEEGFTIDKENKDTWRHAQAGARTIVAVAPKELAIIRKVDTAKLTLEEIIKNCQNDIDIVILEGFKRLVQSKPRILKVVAVKKADEAVETMNLKPIIAYTSSSAQDTEILGIPLVDINHDAEKLVEIIVKNFRAGRDW